MAMSKPMLVLEFSSKRLDSCQRMQLTLRRFEETMGTKHVISNKNIIIIIIYLDCRPVLRIFGEETHFSAAIFYQTNAQLWF